MRQEPSLEDDLCRRRNAGLHVPTVSGLGMRLCVPKRRTSHQVTAREGGRIGVASLVTFSDRYEVLATVETGFGGSFGVAVCGRIHKGTLVPTSPR